MKNKFELIKLNNYKNYLKNHFGICIQQYNKNWITIWLVNKDNLFQKIYKQILEIIDDQKTIYYVFLLV